MIFRQFVHEDLGCASYLVGDDEAGVAAVVDPRLDVEEYLSHARYQGVRIAHILETHTHADHVSGHGPLAAATGATIHINRLADPAYDHAAFDDGWTLELGAVRVKAVHTPGHRPEHTAFLLSDTARGPEPWAVLTGDTLFVGDIARPDLAVEKAEGARGIFHSLHERLLVLPKETEIWPGHLGGSMCGGPAMDMKVSSTIGYETAHNDLLTEPDEERFVSQMLAGLGPQPPNFKAIVDLNRGPLRMGPADPPPLTAHEVDGLRIAGALIADVRTDLQFDESHIPGAACLTVLRPGFGTRLAWVTRSGRDLAIVGRDDADALHAARLAAAVGITEIAGYLVGGMTAWREEGRPVERIERVGVDELAARLTAEPDLQILDVREEAEWLAERIPGSVHVPYHDIQAIPASLDRYRPVAVVCTSGQRGAVAASLLQGFGMLHVLHVVDGGVATWERHGHPTEREPAGAADAADGGR